MEGGEGTTYLQLGISVFLRETNTSTICTCPSFVFCFYLSFHECFSETGGLLHNERPFLNVFFFFHRNEKYFTQFPAWEGEIKLLVKVHGTFWTARATWGQKKERKKKINEGRQTSCRWD